jgi:hypothetical protein
MSSRSDTEYSEPFRRIDAKTAASFQRPKPRPLDRVERALNGSLCETQLTEDEWDRFAAIRDQAYRNKRDWQLSVTGPGVKCVSPGASRRLAEILDDLPPMPYLGIHTMQGLARARRKFRDRVTREVHFFLADMIRAVPATGEPIGEWIGWHLAAFFRISPLVLAVEFPESQELNSFVATNATHAFSHEKLRD